MNDTILLHDYAGGLESGGTDSEGIWRNESSFESPLACDQFLPAGSALATTWFQATVYCLYSTIFVIALLGNGLVCYVVYSSPRMKTVTNFFIVNLAVGDILMAVFCVPTSFISTLILQYWPFGHELCPIVNYSQAVSVLVSAYTLVAISIDRYVAIMWPLKPRMSKTQAKLLILAVWSVALIVSSPIAVVSRLHQPNDHYKKCDQYICQEYWPSLQQRYYYSIALLVLQYLVPLVVLLFTYSSIAIRVWGKHPPGEAENTRDQRMARSKRKMIKMMMTVVIAFTVCWLPFNVLMLVLDNNEGLYNWKGLPFAWPALHWLSMSHSCYNPVIYCWMNARFRSGFITALGRLPCIRRLLPNRRHGTYNTSMAGIALTGFEGGNHSVLRRMNTCTTYVSVRRKANGSHGVPVRSASFRNSETIRSAQEPQRRFIRLECQTEEQIPSHPPVLTPSTQPRGPKTPRTAIYDSHRRQSSPSSPSEDIAGQLAPEEPEKKRKTLQQYTTSYLSGTSVQRAALPDSPHHAVPRPPAPTNANTNQAHLSHSHSTDHAVREERGSSHVDLTSATGTNESGCVTA